MTTCPRCAEPFGDRPAAGSRATTDRRIEICERCGTDEALLAFLGVMPPPEDWPLPAGEITDRLSSWVALEAAAERMRKPLG